MLQCPNGALTQLITRVNSFFILMSGGWLIEAREWRHATVASFSLAVFPVHSDHQGGGGHLEWGWNA